MPLPQRTKREREFATAKPNSKFRKISRQKSLEDSMLDLSKDDHEKNICSQDVRSSVGQDFLEWPDIGTAWPRSQELMNSTPIRSQGAPGFDNYRTRNQSVQKAKGHDAQCQTSNSTSRKKFRSDQGS